MRLNLYLFMRSQAVSATTEKDHPSHSTKKLKLRDSTRKITINSLRQGQRISKSAMSRLRERGLTLVPGAVRSLVDSGASEHFCLRTGTMTENSEPANAYASSAVGGRTDLNVKATATLFLQDSETSEWFDFTLDDKHEKTFVYEPGTFSHDILSFAKLLQSDKIKIKMGQYSDGQLILEVIGDDGEKRRVKLYDKGSLLWLSTRLVDKRVKCNVIACGQENCPTRRRCEKCGKHLGKHKITPNKSQDIGVVKVIAQSLAGTAW